MGPTSSSLKQTVVLETVLPETILNKKLIKLGVYLFFLCSIYLLSKKWVPPKKWGTSGRCFPAFPRRRGCSQQPAKLRGGLWEGSRAHAPGLGTLEKRLIPAVGWGEMLIVHLVVCIYMYLCMYVIKSIEFVDLLYKKKPLRTPLMYYFFSFVGVNPAQRVRVFWAWNDPSRKPSACLRAQYMIIFIIHI